MKPLVHNSHSIPLWLIAPIRQPINRLRSVPAFRSCVTNQVGGRCMVPSICSMSRDPVTTPSLCVPSKHVQRMYDKKQKRREPKLHMLVYSRDVLQMKNVFVNI